MKIAIMQPYFFPYIGYFQLINAVDKFVVYDNIKFTKKGWIQRNRILLNNKDHLISLPIKKDSDQLNINQRYISEQFVDEKEKLKRKILNAYRKAPYFKDIYPLICNILDFGQLNLFDFLYNSINMLRDYLQIETEMIKSSDLPINIEIYKSQEKVINICKSLKVKNYINPIGGLSLYDKASFKKEGISLYFLQTEEIKYKQYDHEFVPNLSIIDVMMFKSREEISNMLKQYNLI